MGKYDKPRETVSARDCICSVCERLIRKGEFCIIDPKKKIATHKNCIK